MFKELKQQINGIDQKLEINIREMGLLKTENNTLKKEINEQDQRIGQLEKEIRKRNLIIQGLTDNENETGAETRENVIQLIQKIKVQGNPAEAIRETQRLGKFQTNKTRPILVEVTHLNEKIEILKSAKNLRNTNIWISEDFPRNIQAQRKELIGHLNEAREKGYRAFLKYNKLCVNGKDYSTDDLKGRNEEEKGHPEPMRIRREEELIVNAYSAR